MLFMFDAKSALAEPFENLYISLKKFSDIIYCSKIDAIQKS
jgi:hypothetical protein